VNKDTNKTFTTTKTNLEFQTNGTLQVGLTRTDTNAAGTVTDTAYAPGRSGSSIVVAYPTPALALDTAFTWRAVLPTLYNGSVCCESQDASSATPSHTIFATPTGSTDTMDPSGWLYTLIKAIDISRISSVEISSLWGGQSIGFPYTGCPHVSCNIPVTTVAGAVYASSVAYLFATTTIITSGPASAPSAATSASPEQTSTPLSVVTPSVATSSEHTTVEVDPVAATPTSPPAGTTQSSGGSHDSDINPSTTGSTVIQALPSTQSSLQKDTTQPLTSAETLPSQTTQAALPLTSSDVPTDQTVGGQATAPDNSAGLSRHVTPDSPAQTSTQATLPSTPDESPTGKSGGGQVSEPGSSAEVSTPVPFNLPDQTSSKQPASTFRSSPSESTSTAPLVTTSFMLVLVSSVAGGEASSTTTVVYVTRLPETTLQPDLSSPDSQTSNIVVDTKPPTISGDTTISSAATLSQDTASFKQLVSGSYVNVNGGDYTTKNVPSTENAAAIVVGGSTIVPDASSRYVISGQSLLPDSSITLVQGSSTAIIALPTGQPGVTQTLVTTGVTPDVPATKSAMPIVIGSNTITPDVSSNYIIYGQTLAAGSKITLISGTSSAVVALQTSNSQTYLVVGTSSSALPEQIKATTSAVPIIVGTNTIQPDALSNYVISGQTLNAGSEITLVSGSSTAIIALQTSDYSQTYLVVGTSTSILSEQTASQGSIQLPEFTIGSSVVTPNSASEYVVASQTLRPGAAITVSGSVISLASHATEIAIGTSTQTAAYHQGFGGYIWSALGADSTLAQTSASSSGSLVSNTDSVLPPASGISSVSGTGVVSSSPPSASPQSPTTTETSGTSVTSALANSGSKTAGSLGAAQARSVVVGLVVLLQFVTLVLV